MKSCAVLFCAIFFCTFLCDTYAAVFVDHTTCPEHFFARFDLDLVEITSVKDDGTKIKRKHTGEFIIEVTKSWAPKGACHFYNLVKNQNFYHNNKLFRAIPGFIVQWGLSGDPQMNRRWVHKEILDDPVKQSNTKGMVSFASAGPNTRATQVFVNYGDNSFLDAQNFAPFGKVVYGFKNLEEVHPRLDHNGPKQSRIRKEGDVYLKQYFSYLTNIQDSYICTTFLKNDPTHSCVVGPGSKTPKRFHMPTDSEAIQHFMHEDNET